MNSRSFRFYPSFWISFLLLFTLVLVIPSLIVYLAGNGSTPANGLFNESKLLPAGSKSEHAQVSPLTIGWVSGDRSRLQHISDYKNLTVVSPDAVIIDSHDSIQVKFDSSLTNTVQKQGKIIWARIMMRSDTTKDVHEFLANPNRIQGLITKIRQAAQVNHWYGVNLDIENVSRTDRGAFSQFIKNLSAELNKTSVVISIDLPPDPNGVNNDTSPFDHKIIGKYCDYIIFMGYDQHWGTDPVPGPITSKSWLKGNLQEFIDTGIPSRKLILGLPSYTRIWELNSQGNIIRDPAEPIQYVENLVRQNHRNLAWDPTLGEYYTSYHVNNMNYKIWLPTAKSFNLYLGLVSQFHLAGSAVWSIDLMQADYWNQIFNPN